MSKTRGLEVERGHALASRPFLRRCANKAATAAACTIGQSQKERNYPTHATNSIERSRSDRALKVPKFRDACGRAASGQVLLWDATFWLGLVSQSSGRLSVI